MARGRLDSAFSFAIPYQKNFICHKSKRDFCWCYIYMKTLRENAQNNSDNNTVQSVQKVLSCSGHTARLYGEISVLVVSKVLIPPIFETFLTLKCGGDTPEKHRIKSLYLQEIYQHNFSFLSISFRSKVTGVWNSWRDQYFWDCLYIDTAWF